MTIDILCRVVDNYGDIGVVYRLARALSELEPELSIRIIVDRLEAFSSLEPAVDPSLAVQSVRGWTVLSWAGPSGDTAGAYREAYAEAPPSVVLECFACGRPDWLEAMLFDTEGAATKTIVNLEYLSAEPYAEEFHRMPSLTRSSRVKKHMFLPGFTGLTGGLILDRPFIDAKARLSDPAAAPSARRIMAEGAGLSLEPGYENRFWMLVFSYERDYGRIVDDMAALARDRPVLALVASGRSEGCFIAAWERAGRPFPVVRVPFLGQERWDELLLASDFAIVRGEDSLSRAALSGKPFLWHAYPQDEAYQLVKVRALLDRMRPQFSAADFRPIEAAFIAFNDRLIDDPQTRGDERILPLLEAGDEVRAGFLRFAEALAVNGNLAAHLMTFLREVV